MHVLNSTEVAVAQGSVLIYFILKLALSSQGVPTAQHLPSWEFQEELGEVLAFKEQPQHFFDILFLLSPEGGKLRCGEVVVKRVTRVLFVTARGFIGGVKCSFTWRVGLELRCGFGLKLSFPEGTCGVQLFCAALGCDRWWLICPPLWNSLFQQRGLSCFSKGCLAFFKVLRQGRVKFSVRNLATDVKIKSYFSLNQPSALQMCQ